MPANEASWILIGKNNAEYVLPPSMIFLGREECDVLLLSQSVDKRHAVITYDHYLHRFKVKDLNSSNGTYVNNVRIDEQTYVKLNHMDTLRFGYDPCVYYIKETAKVNSSPKPDELSNSEMSPSPSFASHTVSPTPSNSSTCQGCIKERIIQRQMSPDANSSNISSPISDDVLHISEEALSMDESYRPSSSVHNTDSVVEHGGAEKLVRNTSPKTAASKAENFPSPTQPHVAITPTNAPDPLNLAQTQSTLLSDNDVFENNSFISGESPINYAALSQPVTVTSQFPPSKNNELTHIQYPNTQALMSASYPSPAYNMLNQPHQVAISHSPMVEAYPTPRYVAPFQQPAYYQSPPPQQYPAAVNSTAVLQSSTDLNAYNSLYHQNIQTAANQINWPVTSSVPSNVIPQSISSNISGDSLEFQNLESNHNEHSSLSSENTIATSLESSSSVAKPQNAAKKDSVDGEMTPLYGQPAWWGEDDSAADDMHVTKSLEENSSKSQLVGVQPASAPVVASATAFTIDFDTPKAAAPSKKLAIKDSIRKYAPPKSSNDELRSHRRSSSLSIEDDIVKEDSKKSTKMNVPKSSTKSQTVSKQTRMHQSGSVSDQNSRSKPDYSKKSIDTSPKDKHIETKISIPMGVTPIKETTAYLIEKMLNSAESNNNSVVHRRNKGSTDDKIRRKTVILSPKGGMVSENGFSILSPNKEEEEENQEFPDNISETGTYTLDVDEPNPEVETARNKIDKALSGSKNSKVSSKSATSIKQNGTSNSQIVPESRPPVAPPRQKNKSEKSPSSIFHSSNTQEFPARHRRKLPTLPIDQAPLDLKSAFSPKYEHEPTKKVGTVNNGDLTFDTKKILKDTENVVTAMQARMKCNTIGHSSPMLMQMHASSSSDSELDVSSASLASDSALLSRPKKYVNVSSKKSYTSDDASRRRNLSSKTFNRPASAGVQSLKLERPNSVQSNSSESSDSSRKKKSPADLKVNRAFELRKARAEDEQVVVKTQPKSRPNSASSSRGIQSSSSSTKLNTDSFTRSDGGRFSLRVKSAPPRQKGPTKKELELAAWNRRKAYNPMKAAAEGKKKTPSKMDESFYTDDEITSPLPSSCSGYNDISSSSKPESQRLEALDILVISSIHQLSNKLRQRSQELISKAIINSYEEEEKNNLQKTLNQMNLTDSPMGNSTRELSSILKNLKRIEIGLDALGHSSGLNQVPNKDDEYY